MIRAIAAALALATLLLSQSQPTAQPESHVVGTDASAFAPLFKFCPQKVESIECVNAKVLPKEFKTPWHRGDIFKKGFELKPLRTFRAGRKFARAGDYEGVHVHELETKIGQLTDIVDPERYDYEKVAGTPCFVQKNNDDNEFATDYGPLEFWITLVDQKYLIFATRRSILQEILARKGPTPEECVERLGWKGADVNWDAAVVIARKYDPQNAQDPISPVSPARPDDFPRSRAPIDRILFNLDAGKKRGRLEVVSRDKNAALNYFRELMGAYEPVVESRPGEEEEPKKQLIEVVSSQGDRHSMIVNFEHLQQEWTAFLWVQMLFGISSYG